MNISAGAIRGVLSLKIKRDLSKSADLLFPYVDEIASVFCGVGETEEENFDNAIVVLSAIKNLDVINEETVKDTIAGELNKILQGMELRIVERKSVLREAALQEAALREVANG
jgi:hypothetical protein